MEATKNGSLTDVEDLEQIEHEVVHPRTGEKLGPVILLAGPEHPKRKALNYSQQRAARKRMAKGDPRKAFAALMDVDPAEEEDQVTDTLVACTLGWRDFAWEEGELVFSAENARKVFTDPKRAWLRRQVLAALNDSEGFIGSSANG